jgi:hypothetical protein
VDDLAEQTVGLSELLLFFFCGPPHKLFPYKPIALASFALWNAESPKSVFHARALRV